MIVNRVGPLPPFGILKGSAGAAVSKRAAEETKENFGTGYFGENTITQVAAPTRGS